MRFRSSRSGDNKLALFLAVLALIIALAVSCAGVQAGQPEPVIDGFNKTGWRYAVVDGMPCIVYTTSGPVISCDWTQWDGRVEGGAIVLPEVGR